MEQVLEDLIESYNSYLSNVEQGSLAIANHLRQDEVGEALQMILDFSEGVSWLVDATQLLKNNRVITYLETENIQQYLTEINDGLEIQDYVLVADLFEYEIALFFAEQQKIEGPTN